MCIKGRKAISLLNICPVINDRSNEKEEKNDYEV